MAPSTVSSMVAVVRESTKKCILIQWRNPLDTVSGILRTGLQSIPLLLLGGYLTHESYGAFPQYAGTADFGSYLLITALLAWAIQNLLIDATWFMVGEIIAGTIESMLLSPAPRIVVFGGSLLAAVISQGMTTGAMLVIGCLVLGTRIPLVGAVRSLVPVTIMTLGIQGYGLALGAVTFATRRPYVTGMVAAVVHLLSGAAYPIGVFPAWMQYLALALPTTTGLDLARHYLLGTPTYLPPTLEAYLLCVSAIPSVVLAVQTIRRVLRTQREGGRSLEW